MKLQSESRTNRKGITNKLMPKFRLSVRAQALFNFYFLFLKKRKLMRSKSLCTLMVKYSVIIEKDEDGVLVARVPDLPGCATEGKTRPELMKNVKEAIQACLEALKEYGDPVPIELIKEVDLSVEEFNKLI
jgi:predicted RNase H-like HicB family nuclease